MNIISLTQQAFDENDQSKPASLPYLKIAKASFTMDGQIILPRYNSIFKNTQYA